MSLRENPDGAGRLRLDLLDAGDAAAAATTDTAQLAYQRGDAAVIRAARLVCKVAPADFSHSKRRHRLYVLSVVGREERDEHRDAARTGDAVLILAVEA